MHILEKQTANSNSSFKLRSRMVCIIISATQHAIWLSKLAKELGITHSIEIFEDNQSCIALVSSEKHQERTKHMNVKFNFIRDCQNKGVIQVKCCPTEKMQADLLTKLLNGSQFTKLRSLIGVSPV